MALGIGWACASLNFKRFCLGKQYSLGRSARRRVAVAFMDKNDLHVESIFDVLSQIMLAMIR
jgi:hypothetical protein